MSAPDIKQACEKVAPLLVFFACDEVEEGERALVEQHLASCEACRNQLAEEKNFQAMLNEVPQPADRLESSGVLLSQCRSELAEMLDDMNQHPVLEKAHFFSGFRRWMAMRPVWSGAALVFCGLLIGVQASQWIASRNSSNSLDHAVNVRAVQPLSDDQLSKIAVAGINVVPASASAGQNIRLQLSSEQPVELTGTLDDSNVRRVLTFVVENGDRFDPGIRLDCLDVLKSRSKDAEVRTALLAAAHKDANPAVRLKALEALRDSSGDEAVREALLETLRTDTNPGVRVEAVNLLVSSLEQQQLVDFEPQTPHTAMHVRHGEIPSPTPVVDPRDASLDNVIQVLEKLQHNDSNRYVRLQSAAALRQISQRNEQ